MVKQQNTNGRNREITIQNVHQVINIFCIQKTLQSILSDIYSIALVTIVLASYQYRVLTDCEINDALYTHNVVISHELNGLQDF